MAACRRGLTMIDRALIEGRLADGWTGAPTRNTNGLLRQHSPKGMSLASLTQGRLDTVADGLDTRRGGTPGFDTPPERLADLPGRTAPDPRVRCEG